MDGPVESETRDRRTVEIAYLLVSSMVIVGVPVALVLGWHRLFGWSLSGGWLWASRATLMVLGCGVAVRGVRLLYRFERLIQQPGDQR